MRQCVDFMLSYYLLCDGISEMKVTCGYYAALLSMVKEKNPLMLLEVVYYFIQFSMNCDA